MTTLAADPVTSIAGLLREAVEGFKLWFQSEDKRRLRRAVDVADKMIRRYREITPKPDKEIDHLIEAFYNILA